MRTRMTGSFKQRQRGMATLVVSLILLFAISLLAFSTARNSLLEQRISGNEYRAKEALYAAEAGLEYGIAWLTTLPADSTPTEPSPQPGALESGTDDYAVNVQFAWQGDGNALISSTAIGVSDSNISVTVQMLVNKDPDSGEVTRLPGTWKDF